MTGDRTRPQFTQSEDGFSLLELLVGLTLFAFILTGIPPALRLANQALLAAGEIDREAADRAGVDFIAQHLAQAMLIYERGDDGRLRGTFRGQPDSFAFVAPARLGPSGGLFLFQVDRVEGSDRKRAIALHWTVFPPALALQGRVLPQGDRVLLADVSELSVAYFGTSRLRETPGWSDTWASNDAIPELVDMRFTSARLNGGRPWRLLVPLRLGARR